MLSQYLIKVEIDEKINIQTSCFYFIMYIIVKIKIED